MTARRPSRRPLIGDPISRVVLALLAVYVIITFGWRSLVQWHRTGDLGFRVSRGSARAAKAASALMVSGSVVGLCGVAGVATGRSTRYSFPGVVRSFGLAVVAVAGTLTTRAQLDLGSSWRIGVDESERTELVTEGTFAVVRNPIFAGMTFTVVGAALAVPSVATWLAAAAVFAGIDLQVRAVEEPYLLRIHGDRYRHYARRTGRFVPGIGRLG